MHFLNDLKMYSKQAVLKRKIEKNISIISLVSSSFCEPVNIGTSGFWKLFYGFIISQLFGKSVGISKLFHRSSLKLDFLLYWTKGQWAVWTLDPIAAARICVWEKRAKVPHRSLSPPIPTLVSSVGVQKTWRQPRKGRPLYIWDMMLLDLAINRVSIFCLKLLLDVNPPPFVSLYKLYILYNCVFYCISNITTFRLGHNSFIHSYLSIYRLLLKQGSESYDSHWLPYHLQCSPCQVEQLQQ